MGLRTASAFDLREINELSLPGAARILLSHENYSTAIYPTNGVPKRGVTHYGRATGLSDNKANPVPARESSRRPRQSRWMLSAPKADIDIMRIRGLEPSHVITKPELRQHIGRIVINDYIGTCHKPFGKLETLRPL
nr:hypothetical protein [Bradyrhizobium sp. CCBAU 21359]